MTVTRKQALQFRLRRHHLAERLSGSDAAALAAVVGLQDTPPGSAVMALGARATVAPASIDDLVIVPSVRGAPLAVRPADLPIFTEGLAPPDEAAAKVVVGTAWKSLDGIGALEALDRVSDAVRKSLGGGPLPRDDFHQALRKALPSEMLWWCKGCGNHHVHPSLWRATGIRGVLAIVGREGRSAVFGAPPAVPPLEDPGAELARRFLSAYGPARPKLLADWAGIATAHAEQLWARAGALAEVDLEGTRAAWILDSDQDAFADDTPVEGVRLLPNLDPLHAARDRELLIPDDALRKRIFTVIGGPGSVLVDGEIRGTWRPAKKGKRLVITATLEGRVTKKLRERLTDEARHFAPFRGAETGEVVVED